MATADSGTGTNLYDPYAQDLPTTPPTWQYAKTPGGGIASPTYVDPTTGEYIDPFTGQGTGYNTTGDAVTPGTYRPAYDITQNPAPPGYHWGPNGTLVQDEPAGGTQTPPDGGTIDPGAGGDSGGNGPIGGTEVPISDLPRITPPPPPDASGYTPTFRGPSPRGQGGEQGFDQGFDQSFSSLIPRVAGNDVTRPGDISGQRAQVPAWARGLMRSPYARAQGGRSSFSQIGGFQPDVAVDPAEEQRRQQQALLALGLPPVA